MNNDIFVLGNAFLCAVWALGVHIIGFRFVPDRRVLSWLMGVFVVGAMMNLGASWSWPGSLTLPMSERVVIALFSALLYGLFSFMYFVLVLGPYESSIRLRLIRELDRGGDQGLTRAELLGRYNAGVILRIRLDRLTGSGEVIREGEEFRIGRTPVLFLVLNGASVLLGRWAGVRAQVPLPEGGEDVR